MTRSAEQQKLYRLRKWQWLKENLGDSCAFCGTIERLELDHINPNLKKYKGRTISKSYAQLESELSNLRILCHDCHCKLTSKQVRNEEIKRGWKARNNP